MRRMNLNSPRHRQHAARICTETAGYLPGMVRFKMKRAKERLEGLARGWGGDKRMKWFHHGVGQPNRKTYGIRQEWYQRSRGAEQNETTCHKLHRHGTPRRQWRIHVTLQRATVFQLGYRSHITCVRCAHVASHIVHCTSMALVIGEFRFQEDKVGTSVGMARRGLCTSTNKGQHKRVKRCKKKLQRSVQLMASSATEICCDVHRARL